MRLIDRGQLQARLSDPSLVLVDVLPEVSWAEAHIPGALSLPVEDIPRLAAKRLPDPSREIVVYCGGPT